jgi:SPP1 gp7 family putative phage head morphogenesis protein
LLLSEKPKKSRTLPVIMRAGPYTFRDGRAWAPSVVVHQTAPAKRYAFPSDPAGKAQAFMDWLRGAEESEILEVLTRDGHRITSVYPWQNTYVRSAYARGVTQASAQLRQAKIVIPQFSMAAVFNYPMHADALALLFSRNFTDLKGITDEMSAQIARVLTEGLSSGVGPKQVAKLIAGRVDKIGIVRGELLARTEIIRAHAEATLNRYQEFGVEGVTGDVELQTSEDDKVCELCKGLVGKVFTIEEARGVLPLHPNDRCAWKPVINP